MRKIKVAIGVGLLAVTLAACDVTPGGRCDQVGSKHTNDNGYAYTCTKLFDGRTIWQQDEQLDPDRP